MLKDCVEDCVEVCVEDVVEDCVEDVVDDVVEDVVDDLVVSSKSSGSVLFVGVNGRVSILVLAGTTCQSDSCFGM